MSHNHYHYGCSHNLVLCPICDTVYCTKCGKEWSTSLTYTTGPYVYYPWTSPYSGTITHEISSAGNLIPVQNSGVHTHKCP